ncbi:GDSL-type esterase/lipase family protein [Kribbella sp. NPDC005582]|uniref:poly(ethylene terephthalate) hydrolase family protein n=1 Tax=Kribbella sp. NPDC005582 TaxID=3156893 RepID=UPI0033A34DB0
MPTNLRRMLVVLAVVLAVLMPQATTALAADNPYQRGPDPTQASIAASRGTFATAEVSVGSGNGFGAAKIYYPTDTSQGTFGAIAIVPGYTATWAAEGAWMGPWLASFGFVVIGIDTLSRNDFDTARGTQLLAALDYLTQRSSVRSRVDASRLAVMGHSMGGGGAISAALRRPSLSATVGLAPYSPSQGTSGMKVPAMLLAGQRDGTVSPSSVKSLYNAVPATTEKAYLELTGAGHGFPTSANSVMMRKVVPWLKIFVDRDTRYTQFLCPLVDRTGITSYESSCPLVPPGGGQVNQKWTQTAAAELRIYNNTKCLDAATGRVVISACNGSANQKWAVNANGTVTSSGRCLDTAGGATADNTAVVVATCTGGAGQSWSKTAALATLLAAGDGSPTDSNIKYVGRWDTRSSSAYVPGWAGAYAVVGFTGTTVKLRQRNSVDLYASIDGRPWVSYRGVSGLVNLTPTRLTAGTHTLRVSYRQATGSYRGDLVFQGVTLDAGARTVAATVPSRTIEFIGDSITAGEKASKMAVTSYGWLTGEKLGAAHVQVARASVCLYPASGCIGLRDRYLKTTVDATSPDWDFSRYQASDVLINLGTNDRGHGVSSAQFQSAYITLMQRIRAKYPNATIHAMETFQKLYVNETKAAVATRNAAGDSKVRFINTEGWITVSTDTADGTHPNDAGHQKIANRLVPLLTASAAAAPEAACSKGYVGLTFYDGPTSNTPALLRARTENGLRATS